MEKIPQLEEKVEIVASQTLSSLSDEINNAIRKFSKKGYTLRGIPHVASESNTNGYYTTLVFDKSDVKSENARIVVSHGVKLLAHEINVIIKEFSREGYTLRGIPHVAYDKNELKFYSLLIFEKL